MTTMQIDGQSAFVISKPLQLMIALFILRHLGTDARPQFLITNDFAGAKGVVGRLQTEFALQARFFETQPQVYAHLSAAKYNHVFIDSDVGLRKAISLLRLRLARQKMAIYVFEEGVGTYRDNLYRGLKARFFPLMGIATRFGASPMISRIIVLDSNEYRLRFPDLAHKVLGVDGKFWQFLNQERQALNAVFGFSGLARHLGNARSECTLYLSNWSLDEKILDRLMTIPDDLYVKPHPHIERSRIRQGGFLERVAWIDSGIPAELAILALLDRYQNVIVLDHFSSARRYVISPRVSFRAMSANA